MAHSLEVRSPLLDHRIVEFAASLPEKMRLKGFRGKYILRALSAKKFPQHILNRPKRGFNAPVSYWLANELREIGQDVTLGSKILNHVEKEPIEKLWHEHLSKKKDNGLKLFGLLCLGIWLMRHSANSGSRAVPC